MLQAAICGGVNALCGDPEDQSAGILPIARMGEEALTEISRLTLGRRTSGSFSTGQTYLPAALDAVEFNARN
jgi:hypothetical protein